MKGWLLGGTTVLLVLVCEGEEKFLNKGMGGDTEIPEKGWRQQNAGQV